MTAKLNVPPLTPTREVAYVFLIKQVNGHYNVRVCEDEESPFFYR